MKFAMTDADVRHTLDQLIRDRGDDYRAISLLLGRNAAYVQQFIKRGTPKKLDEDDRARLASYFNVSEELLGGRSAVPPQAANDDSIAVPLRDIRASAGHGALSDLDYIAGHIRLSRSFLRQLGADMGQLSFIEVQGQSMQPTLEDGDTILVDASKRTPQKRGGVFVLRRDGTLMVKRVAKGAKPGTLDIVSDNAAFESLSAIPQQGIDVLGRVLWISRSLA